MGAIWGYLNGLIIWFLIWKRPDLLLMIIAFCHSSPEVHSIWKKNLLQMRKCLSFSIICLFQFVTKVYRKFNLLLLLNKYSILYGTADLTRSTGPLAAGQTHLTLNTLAP